MQSTNPKTAPVRERNLLVKSIATLTFNVDAIITQANAVALEWFGDILLNQTQFGDDWLTRAEIHLNDRHFRTLFVDDLLKGLHSDRYLGIGFGDHTKWVQWSLQQEDTYSVLTLIDVSDLMQEVLGLQERAEAANTYDIATHLYNRRYALERLAQMHHHAKRYNSPFAVAMIDIDHFKRINDTFGHEFGDDVLERLAGVMKRSFRETDLCARFGGEEFLVLMPETETHDAILSLDRLRQQVSELKWAQMQRPITISSGVIGWQANKSVEQLIFLADQRLSTAKKAGRNQVCGDLT